MKLEVIHPVSKNHIFPATVCKVFNEKYFLVEIDDMRDPEERSIVRLSCHGNQIGIFPITWCQSQGIKLSTPRGTFKHLTKYHIWLSWEHFQIFVSPAKRGKHIRTMSPLLTQVASLLVSD